MHHPSRAVSFLLGSADMDLLPLALEAIKPHSIRMSITSWWSCAFAPGPESSQHRPSIKVTTFGQMGSRDGDGDQAIRGSAPQRDTF